MTDREKKLEIALAVIEGLCMEAGDDKLSGSIYRVAHVALGYCKTCKNDAFIHDIAEQLKIDGITDAEHMEENYVLKALNGLNHDEKMQSRLAGEK